MQSKFLRSANVRINVRFMKLQSTTNRQPRLFSFRTSKAREADFKPFLESQSYKRLS